ENPPKSVTAQQTQPQVSEAAQAWSVVMDTTDIHTLNAFIERFGDSSYGTLAKARLAQMKQAEIAQQVASAANKKGDDTGRGKFEADRQNLAMLQREDGAGVKREATAVAADEVIFNVLKSKGGVTIAIKETGDRIFFDAGGSSAIRERLGLDFLSTH